jgi:hypothetical protein
VLLSDTQVIQFVNDNFVACWQMVRPVPQVTITFGNGKTLKRTLGGNTTFEVCLPDGRVVDAFPGLYVPADFLAEAGRTLQFVRTLKSGKTDAAVTAAVIDWHKARGAAQPPLRVSLSVEKSLVEGPLLRALRAEPTRPLKTDLLASELGRIPVVLDASEEPGAALTRISRQLEDVSKQPATVEQLRERFLSLPDARRPTPEQLGEMALRVDSRTNVVWTRAAIHLLFATYDRLPRGWECRDTVFKQLLHIPVDDPYLGLADALVPGTPGGS